MSDTTEALDLDSIGILEGTDKTFLAQNYLRQYEGYLRPYKDRKINLLEIGVAEGGSLRTWRRFFSQATIIGVDNNPACKRYEQGSTIVRIGSQYDPEFLARVAAEFPPTVIIDDGSHRADHVMFTFDRLFPVLAPGGCYIVEDLFLHRGPSEERYRGSAAESPIEFLGRIAAGVMGRVTPVGIDVGMAEYLRDHIEKMVIIPSAVLLFKRDVQSDISSDVARAMEMIGRSEGKGNWVHILDHVVTHKGPLHLAESAGRRAIAEDPRNAHAYARLGVVLEMRGELRAALEALESAVNVAGDSNARTIYGQHRDRLKAQLASR